MVWLWLMVPKRRDFLRRNEAVDHAWFSDKVTQFPTQPTYILPMILLNHFPGYFNCGMFFDWDVLAHISSKVNDLCYHLLYHWYWYFNDSWTFCLTSERSISSFLDINAITNFSISIVIVGKPNKIKIIWLNYWVKLHKNS